MAVKLVQGTMLFRTADVASVDKENRTATMVFTTGYKGKRTDPWFGDEWNEELAVDPQSIRLDRLNAGAPLLDTHTQRGVSNVLGSVTKAWVENGQGMATVKFSRRPDADQIFQDVQDGILRNVSVGYRVHKWEDVSENDDKIPTFRATDWEPFEVSLVPIGFDPGAQIRSSEVPRTETFPMEVISNRAMSGETNKKGHQPMTPEEQRAAAEEAKRAEAERTRAAEEKARAEAVVAERKRVAEITRNCEMVKLDPSFVRKLIEDGVSIEDARKQIIDEVAARSEKATTVSTTSRVQAGDLDENKTRADAIENAILHRAFPNDKRNELTEAAREWRSLTLPEMARKFLGRAGLNADSMSRSQLAEAALQVRGGYNATTDFPNVLANVLNKSLLQGYEQLFQAQTFRPFVRIKTAPDFKQVSRTRLGEVPSLEQVPEGAEIKRGSLTDNKEVYNLATYAKIFSISREVIINDDLAAFTDIPRKFGSAASRLESDLVYSVVNNNANMSDGNALFSSSHGNLAGSGAAISVTTIGAARQAMRTQKGLAKKDYLNINGKFLVVPAAQETVADQLVSTALLANQPNSINPFAGRLQVIAEPRLDGTSTTAWYLVADPADGVDTIELLYLDGATGPQIQTDLGFGTNGISVKALLDIAAKAIDWRGMYKNPGS